MKRDNPLQDLELRVELIRLVQSTEIDVAEVKAVIKDRYLRLAFQYHPDRRKDINHSFAACFSAAYSAFSHASDEEIKQYVISFIQERGEDTKILELAQQEITRLDEQLNQAYKDLRSAQMALLSITQKEKSYKPKDILVYQDTHLGIRITLDNAAQEIRKLTQPKGLENILQEKLKILETELRESREHIEKYREQERKAGSPMKRITELENEVQQLKRDHADSMLQAENLVTRLQHEHAQKLAKYTAVMEGPGAAEEKDMITKIDKARREGNFRQALIYCAKLNQLVPGSSAPTYFAGLIFEQQGKMSEAGRCYRRALQRDNDHPLAKISLERVQSKLKNRIIAATNDKKYEVALEWCEKLEKIDPDDTDAIYLTAKVYTQQGDYHKADEFFKRLPWMKGLEDNLKSEIEIELPD